MIKLLEDVAAFHRVTGTPVAHIPELVSTDRAILRANLIAEEYRETVEALDTGDLLGIADGLADLIYVCVGTALEYGIPLDRVWAEVQRANMAKAGGPRRADGKILKPEGWVPPDVEGAVFGKRLEETSP